MKILKINKFKKEEIFKYERALKLMSTYPAINQKVLSLAPVRTKPRRHYDVFVDEFKPEGDHIPIRLASFLQSSESRKKKNEIQKALNEFGLESGLYDEINIKMDQFKTKQH